MVISHHPQHCSVQTSDIETLTYPVLGMLHSAHGNAKVPQQKGDKKQCSKSILVASDRPSSKNFQQTNARTCISAQCNNLHHRLYFE